MFPVGLVRSFNHGFGVCAELFPKMMLGRTAATTLPAYEGERATGPLGLGLGTGLSGQAGEPGHLLLPQLFGQCRLLFGAGGFFGLLGQRLGLAFLAFGFSFG